MGLKIEGTIREQLRNSNDLHFLLVENMSKLMTGKVNRVDSSDFEVSGLKWRLFIRPNDGLKDHLAFYLWVTDEKCTGPNWEVRCNCRLSIVPRTGQDKWNAIKGCHHQKYPLQGVKDFISYRELEERFLENDAAAFCAKITNVQPSFHITSIHQPKGTAERIKLIDVPRSNCRFTWKITQFSSFSDEKHFSYDFTVGQRRWKLVMYPNGGGEEKGKSLSLYLKACDHVNSAPKWRTLAVYKLRVLDLRNRNHHEISQENWFANDPDAIQSTLGCLKFLPLEELHKPSRGFLVKDEIYVGVEFLIVSTSETIYP